MIQWSGLPKVVPTLALLIATHAQAWDQHQFINEAIMDSASNTDSRPYLHQKIKTPGGKSERETLELLSRELKINGAKVPVFLENSETVTVEALLTSAMIDEPDFGMDQDLPSEYDASDERKWMGGATGPTSQGFRHMLFPGIEWWSPIQTFQLPLHSIGQAEERILSLRARSDRFFSEGNLFWGYRTLFWMLHYVQDLHQPFHVTQVPERRMLPFKELFSHFVARTTQIISNYHYAFEGLALEFVKTAAQDDFGQCFAVNEPRTIVKVLDLVHETRKVAPGVGKTLYALFGNEMKDPEMDLPNDKGSIDYYSFAHANLDEIPEIEVASLKVLKELTCAQMKSVSSYTLGEIDRAHGLSENSKSTGK